MSPELLHLLQAARELGLPGALALGVAGVAWAELRLFPRLAGPLRLLRAIGARVGLSEDELRAAELGKAAAA